MSGLLEERDIHCPWCDACFTALLDLSAGDCSYIEDCRVCCEPITFILHVEETGEAELELRRDDD
jgi:hypothetical protein